MLEKVTVLAPRERAGLDAERLDMLCMQVGPAAAEDMVCRAMEELAGRLGHIEELYFAEDRSLLRKNVRALVAIAEQIGMMGVGRVARDVMTCIDDGDDTALAATLARLARTGERSLTEIWDLSNLSI